jgi:hypothetical protein
MAARPRQSAMAALREFFNLSPLWMKGAVACAAILFCVFAGLLLARPQEKPRSALVTAPIVTPNSTQEFDAAVERRVQEELQRIKNSNDTLANSAVAENGSARKNPVKRTAHQNIEVASAGSSQRARRPLSKTEREQLAADLRLVSANDGDLDLLGDRINQ